jgi:hypothetical protein
MLFGSAVVAGASLWVSSAPTRSPDTPEPTIVKTIEEVVPLAIGFFGGGGLVLGGLFMEVDALGGLRDLRRSAQRSIAIAP